MNQLNGEERFYKALQDIFVGARVAGQGGFINLMKIKGDYYRQIEKHLRADIERAVAEHPGFRNELYLKLHDFFDRYFTQNGSICFDKTAFHNDVYEKVYADNKDVALFWKTQMLYYVKTDTIFHDMPVEFGVLRFFFDASGIEQKKMNEKRDVIFSFRKVEDGIIYFDTRYSENGTKSDVGEMLKRIKKDVPEITEPDLLRAFRMFNRQSECDYFINKDAEKFLKEQFMLTAGQYYWKGAEKWDADRVNELQALKRAAFMVIEFIAQFEDELARVWNKPKFVKNANYVITLDRVKPAIAAKIKKHKGYAAQADEWNTLGIDKASPKAPIDTKFFKDLELDILAQFENLDESLDGWLIKSENYQALNTILPKFRNKVQCVYIDPPFNTGKDFDYVDMLQDSTWLTLMENRLELSVDFLKTDGSYLLHLDKNASHYGRTLLGLCMKLDVSNEIIWDKGFRGTESQNIFQNSHDTVFFVKMTDDSVWNQPTQAYKDQEHGRYDQTDEDGRKYALVKRTRTDGSVYYGKTYPKEEGKSANDVISYIPTMASTNKQRWNGFQTQKPEELIQVFIEATSDPASIVLDFYAGSGTTLAAAHKSGRKWLGVEMGDYFEHVTLSRMKEVLAAQGNHEPCGITKDVAWQGGGFFKYYELEQYEEALANCKYADGDVLTRPDQSVYEQYVFLADEKLLAALEPDFPGNKVDVKLERLYDNIDVAETLSNLSGKWIKSIGKDKARFADGEEVAMRNLSRKQVKPLIWWEKEYESS